MERNMTSLSSPWNVAALPHSNRRRLYSLIGISRFKMRSLFLQRRDLLPQREVFDREVGAAPTHRPQRTCAERHEKDEYAKHGGGVSPFAARNLRTASGA